MFFIEWRGNGVVSSTVWEWHAAVAAPPPLPEVRDTYDVYVGSLYATEDLTPDRTIDALIARYETEVLDPPTVVDDEQDLDTDSLVPARTTVGLPVKYATVALPVERSTSEVKTESVGLTSERAAVEATPNRETVRMPE